MISWVVLISLVGTYMAGALSCNCHELLILEDIIQDVLLPKGDSFTGDNRLCIRDFCMQIKKPWIWGFVKLGFNKQTNLCTSKYLTLFSGQKSRSLERIFFLFSNEASKILDVVKTEMFARRSVYPPGGHFHCLTGFIHKDLLCPWNHYNRYDINFTYDLK